MKIKIISLILTLAIVFSVICFPASASIALPSNIVDLRSDTNEYWWTSEGSESVLTTSFYFSSNPTNRIFVNWTLPRIELCTSVHFAIHSTVRPSSVYFDSDGSFGQSEAVYTGSNNNIHYYSVSGNGHLGQVSITFGFSSPYQGVIDLMSCTGFLNSAIPVTFGSLQLQYAIYDSGNDSLRRQQIDQASGSLPLQISRQDVGQYSNVIDNLFFMTYIPGHLPVSSCSTISFLIYSCGNIEDPVLSIINKSGAYVSVLEPITDSYTTVKSTSRYFGGTAQWPIWIHSFSFDVSGFNFEEYGCTLEYSVDFVPINGTGYPEGVYSEVVGIAVSPESISLPWYTRLFEFFNYHFSNLIGYISSGYNNMVSAINNLFNGIGSWFSTTWGHITGGFTDVKNTIVQWGQNIVNALTGTNSDAQDALDQSDQISGELGDVNQEMNDLEKPDLDNINPDLENAIPGGLSTSYSGFLAAIIQNPILYQVIGISLLISFAGYVLYGKR